MVITGCDGSENFVFLTETKQLQDFGSSHWAAALIATKCRREVPISIRADEYKAVETINRSAAEGLSLHEKRLSGNDGVVTAFVERFYYVECFAGIAKSNLLQLSHLFL